VNAQPASQRAHANTLLNIVAVVLFVLAALAGFHWLIHTGIDTTLGLVAAGLACLAAQL
jgi:hypothetical protein